MERRLSDGKNESGDGVLRRRAFEIVFRSDTYAGKAFDVLLILIILASVLVVMLQSVEDLNQRFGTAFLRLEWFFTLLFTAEYLVRLWCVHKPLRYAGSFFGVIDLLAVLPSYLALVLTGATSVLVIRLLRILRLFRVLKLSRYVSASSLLIQAMKQSLSKIVVFLFAVLSFVVIFGAMLHMIEGPEHGFTSIPQSVYWAIVTLTTVGYGDIVPQTVAGKALASIVMVCGYGVIAVPTGIYASELRGAMLQRRASQKCPECSATGHEEDAAYCRKCGARLREPEIFQGE
ncbi:MAG: ion transporter [Gammaproteobacteria bacterium]